MLNYETSPFLCDIQERNNINFGSNDEIEIDDEDEDIDDFFNDDLNFPDDDDNDDFLNDILFESKNNDDNFHQNPNHDDYQWLLNMIKNLCDRAGSPNEFSSIYYQLQQRKIIPDAEANSSFHQNYNRKQSIARTGSPFSQFYDVIDNIGEGGYGKVMKIMNLIDKQYYALKVIKIDRSEVKMALREVQALAHLQSPRLVRYYNSWIEGNENSHHLSFYIQTEYVDGQSLSNLLRENAGHITLKNIYHILTELAFALNDIHKAGIVHRDFRPSNVMIRPDGSIVVIDFGISSVRYLLRNTTPDVSPPKVQIPQRVGSLTIRPFDQVMIREAAAPDTTIKKVGTPIYSSPSQLSGRKSFKSDDIYSLGIIIFEVFSQFKTDMEKIKLIRDLRSRQKLPDDFVSKYPEESELIIKMVDPLRENRPNIRKIIESEIFKKWLDNQ